MTVYISTMDNEHQTETTDLDNTIDSQLKVKREQYEENEIRLKVTGFLPDEIPSTHYNPKGPATPKSTFLLGDDMHRGPNPVGRPRKSGLEPVCQVCGKKYHNHSNLAGTLCVCVIDDKQDYPVSRYFPSRTDFNSG